MSLERLQEMVEAMRSAPPEVAPSKFWEELNEKNLRQLAEFGYDNFKRTVATNYFTWLLIDPLDAQFTFLREHLPKSVQEMAEKRTRETPVHDIFTPEQSLYYTLLTYLLWEYVARAGGGRYLARLQEPVEGNPPRVYKRRRLISQDIANSVLEFETVRSHIRRRPKTIIELGPGYGRTAYAFLRLLPHVRYILIDIPPALYIAERYLSNVLERRRIFTYRPFTDFSQVKAEFEASQIAFLLPTQIELLPDHYADLFINISSLHEMRKDQIAYYFKQINRLTRGHLYTKQWKVSLLPQENTTIIPEDYPVEPHWRPLLWRECRVQTYFFEAIYRMNM